MAQKKYTFYDVQPSVPSAIDFIRQDAERLPLKVERLIASYLPVKFVHLNGSEKYELSKAEWSSLPKHDLTSSTQLTRDLKLTFTCEKRSGAAAEKRTLPLTIQQIPYIDTKGAFHYGPNEYFATNELVQKPGIFPISSELRNNAKNNQHILWKTPSCVFLQTSDSLIVHSSDLSSHLSSRQMNLNSKPVVIPKELWQSFSSLLEGFRERHKSTSPLKLLPSDSPLHAILNKALNLAEHEHHPFYLHTWLEHIAQERVPKGNWQKRLEYLAQTNPDLEKDLKSLMLNPAWNIRTAQSALNLQTKLHQAHFLETGDIGRLKVETGMDKMASLIFSEVKQVFTEAKFQFERSQKSTFALQIPWIRKNWEDRLKRNFIHSKFPKYINEEPTVQSIVIKATTLKVNLSLFNRFENQLTDVERRYHPSMTGYIANSTPENANVGRDRWLCSGARLNEFGEPMKPIVFSPEQENPKRKWLEPESYEILENKLFKQHSGIHIGKIEFSNSSGNYLYLRIKNQIVTKVNSRDNVPAYLDYTPQDNLPIHLAIANRVNQIDPSRTPMLHAGISGSRTAMGSEKPAQLFAETEKANIQITQCGLIGTSPISGTVTEVSEFQGFGRIVIKDIESNDHIIEYPTAKANAFSNRIGPAAYVQANQQLKQGEIIIGPNHPAYIRQFHNQSNKEKLSLYPGVNMNAVILPEGIEDQMIVSQQVVASGRLNEISVIREFTERSHYPIHINKMLPGSVITPGEILAYQIIEGDKVPIIAGNDQGGILLGVRFIDDPLAPSQSLTQVVLENSAFNQPNLSSIVERELNEALKPFLQLYESIDKDYISALLKERQVDINKCATHLTYRYKNSSYGFYLLELQKGSSQWDLIKTHFHDPENISINKNESYLNERLLYTCEKLARYKQLIQSNPFNTEPPKFAAQVVFEIEQEIKIQNGSKLNDFNGTKGIISISPYLPYVEHNHRVTPAELAFTTHAVAARGSISRYYNLSDKSHKQIQPTILRSHKDSLQEISVECIKVYQFLQKQNPDRNNRLCGRSPYQGRDYLNRSTQGAKMNPESMVLISPALPIIEKDMMQTKTKATISS